MAVNEFQNLFSYYNWLYRIITRTVSGLTFAILCVDVCEETTLLV